MDWVAVEDRCLDDPVHGNVKVWNVIFNGVKPMAKLQREKKCCLDIPEKINIGLNEKSLKFHLMKHSLKTGVSHPLILFPFSTPPLLQMRSVALYHFLAIYQVRKVGEPGLKWDLMMNK